MNPKLARQIARDQVNCDQVLGSSIRNEGLQASPSGDGA